MTEISLWGMLGSTLILHLLAWPFPISTEIIVLTTFACNPPSSISPLPVYGSLHFSDHITFIFIHVHFVLASAFGLHMFLDLDCAPLNYSRINTTEFLSNQTILEFVGVKRLLRFRELFVLLIFLILYLKWIFCLVFFLSLSLAM